MIRFTKFLTFLAITAAFAYVGWRTYNYFFLISTPTFELIGIQPKGSYAGDVQAAVKGHDDFKVARLTIKVDGKPLVDQVKIGRRNFEYPFVLPTKILEPGKHTLDIEIENGAYHKKKASQSFSFFVDNSPLQAAFVKNESDAKIPQGRTLHVQFQANKELKEANLKTLSKVYPCMRESDRTALYECFVPIDTEEVPNEYLMTIDAVDPVGNTITLQGKFQVVAFPFKKQTLRLESEKMKAENEAGASEKQFEAEIEELTKKSPHQKLWHGNFITPIEVKDPKQITTEYGVTRATQERGLRQHKALDLYAAPKSVVWATQDGIVALKSRFAHSGNTVVIDHGWGILSMYFHLDTFAPIEVGEKIKKGNPVGTLGKTGYATGYHLHWEMRVGNVAIDPMEWTNPGF